MKVSPVTSHVITHLMKSALLSVPFTPVKVKSSDV